MCLGFPESATYNFFSSGEKQSPFGMSKSRAAMRMSFCLGIEAIDIVAIGFFGFAFWKAVRGIGEPDCSVGFYHDVIRGAEFFPVILIHERLQLALFINNAYAAASVLA
jgi:hypothetical protein